MPTFIARVSNSRANNEMLDLYNNYKFGMEIDDCWSITEEDFDPKGTFYEDNPILLEDCPIFESADHNIKKLDQISSFTVIENPNHCVCFDRCKSNEYWEIGPLIQ